MKKILNLLTIAAFIGATSSCMHAADKFVGFGLMNNDAKVKDAVHNVLVEALEKNGRIEDDELTIKEKELAQDPSDLPQVEGALCYKVIESILSKNYSKLRLYSVSIVIADRDTSTSIKRNDEALSKLASHASKSSAVANIKYDVIVEGIHLSMFAYFLMTATVGGIIAGILYATGFLAPAEVSEEKKEEKA